MREKSISVTEAARNFADCVNRVRYQNASFVLLRNGSPVARLIPDAGKVCSGRDLSEILAVNSLSDEETATWRRDLQAARQTLMAPPNRW